MSNKKFKKNSNGGNTVKVSGVSKRIKNDMSSIRDVENITAKEKLKLRCKCQHIDENGKTMLSVVRIKNLILLVALCLYADFVVPILIFMK